MSNRVLKLMVWLDAPPVAHKGGQIGQNSTLNIAGTTYSSVGLPLTVSARVSDALGDVIWMTAFCTLLNLNSIILPIKQLVPAGTVQQKFAEHILVRCSAAED